MGTPIITANSALVYDSSLSGGVDANGQIQQLWGPDALNNSITMWLLSFEGDIIRVPKRGGYITPWLFKPMNTKNIDKISMAVRNGITQDFIPTLTLLAMSITPNFDKRYWEVFLQVFAKSLQIGTTVSVNLRNQV